MRADMANDLPAYPAPSDSFVVRPKGRMNMAVASDFRVALIAHIEEGKSRLVVDLIDVETIDSSIVGALVAAVKVARRSGGDVRIVAPSTQVAEILKMANLTRVLPAYPSVEEAFKG